MLSKPVFEESISPIFIVGAPRSGTSITTWALGQHPNIQPMPETGWIASMAVAGYLSHQKGSERGRFSHLSNVEYPLEPFMRRIGESIHHVVNDVFNERCSRLYRNYSDSPDWRPLAKVLSDPMQVKRAGTDPKKRWIDGTPLNSFHLWVLTLVFPGARFIHNLRCPDEVATSLEGFDRVGAEPQALDQGLQTWIEHTENAWFVERGLGADKAFRLDFQRVGGDAERLLQEVCEFLGEEFSPDCLLPLGRRLNSSEVDDRRSTNLDVLRNNAMFQKAQALYQSVNAHPPAGTPEPEMMGILKQRFLDYAHDRSIV